MHQDTELEVLPLVQFLEDGRVFGPYVPVGLFVDETVLGEEGGGRQEARQGKKDPFHSGQHLDKYRDFSRKKPYLCFPN